MNDIKYKEQLLIDDFEALSSWEDKYDYLMALAAELPAIDPAGKTAETLVEGCRSASWLKAETKDGRLYFQADSEAPLGRGVMSLLLQIVNGHTPEEIAGYDFRILRAIDLEKHLSPVRRAGLRAFIERIKTIARENLQ